MRNRGKRSNLKRQLVVSITALLFTSVIIVSLAGSLWYQNHFIRTAAEKTESIVEQIALNTGLYIDELSRLSMAPYYNADIMNLLDTNPQAAAEKLSKKRTIEGYLREVMTIPRKEILRVYIISDDIYYTTRTSHSISLHSDYASEDWYRKALESTDLIFLPVQTETESGYTLSVFSLVRQLRSLRADNHTIGVIRVDADYTGISEVLNPVELNNNSALYMLDDSGNVIYQRSSLPEAIDPELLSRNLTFENGIENLTLNGSGYIVNSQNIEGTNWYVVEITSRSQLLKEAAPIRIFSLILAILCSVMGLVFSVLYVRTFLQPINTTIGVMQRSQGGDLSLRAPECDVEEINYLNETYNDLLDQIQRTMEGNRRLTKKIYEAKYLQQKAEYDSLCQQIRPHFLFNTLNTISLLIKTRQDAEALKAIDELSVLLRGMVNADSEISLLSELHITESYLSLQSRRHEKLSYSIRVDKELHKLLLPAMTIQPLVENAIIHGCEPKATGTHISITADYAPPYAVFCISDTGMGMPKETLDQLKTHLFTDSDTSTETSGVGVTNIAKRLKLKYGEPLQFEIDSVPDKGTTITIHIPLTIRTEFANETGI
ncbi:MAG: sensor histidine kinase [Lachnospiraceae bacterium]|nr:sensor histidine kinase [Lachnospiraceae bacterium]